MQRCVRLMRATIPRTCFLGWITTLALGVPVPLLDIVQLFDTSDVVLVADVQRLSALGTTMLDVMLRRAAAEALRHTASASVWQKSPHRTAGRPQSTTSPYTKRRFWSTGGSGRKPNGKTNRSPAPRWLLRDVFLNSFQSKSPSMRTCHSRG